MVRTRPRNKTRRAVVIDYDSDGEPPEAAHDDSEDDNFEAHPEDDEDDRMDLDGGGEDDFEADDPSSLALDDIDNDFDDEDDEQPAYTSSAGLRKQPVDLGVLEKYHADGRPTRHYTGALKRGQRMQVLDYFYGPEQDAIGIAGWILNRWAGHGVLPSKVTGGDACPIPSPWLEEGYWELQRQAADAWFVRVKDAKGVKEGERVMDKEYAKGYRVGVGGGLKMLLGPYPEQKEVCIMPSESIVLSETGLPLKEGMKEKAAGFMFDVGGLVIGMDWAIRDEGESQILALAIVPHSDQELDAESTYDEQKGLIQLWEMHSRSDDNDMIYPQNRPARLARTICADWGRIKKIKWCPVKLTQNRSLGLMALLCGDGQVHVISIKDVDDGQCSFTKLEHQIVSLRLPCETNVTITCFAWVTTNRIVTGHSDGSLILWSIAPRGCLARHDVHSTWVMDIDTAYPSNPYLVASTPIAGYTTLVDLSDPSCERTSFPCFMISPQPNLLQWNDHLRGFFSVVPSANPLNSSVGFIHSRWYAAQVRKVMDGDRLPTCLAVGSHHPFVLVGYLDGTVWAANPASRVFASKHHFGHKIKVFEHQYIPRERLPLSSLNTKGKGGDFRGVVRILQGFRPIPNLNPKVDNWKYKVSTNKKKDKKKAKKSKAKAKGMTETDAAEDDDADVQGGQEEGDGHFADPKRAVLSEALTRVMTMAWNPNREVSCWAAVAMASGLVRVMDLGVEV